MYTIAQATVRLKCLADCLFFFNAEDNKLA